MSSLEKAHCLLSYLKELREEMDGVEVAIQAVEKIISIDFGTTPNQLIKKCMIESLWTGAGNEY